MNKVKAAKQQKKESEEREARQLADDAPGAAHGRGQFRRQQQLAQAAATAAAEAARQKVTAEAQRLRDEEAQIEVAMGLMDETEQ
eukprot:1945064-Rhodomonas_salina.1